jgi:hypothetical protein
VQTIPGAKDARQRTASLPCWPTCEAIHLGAAQDQRPSLATGRWLPVPADDLVRGCRCPRLSRYRDSAGCASENLSIRSIVLDNVNGGHEAANALIEQDHHWIGFIKQVNGIPAVFALQNVRS